MCIRDRGKITLGGKDIRDISQRDLREELGYVPQKGVLFSGTIGSNIMYGNPNGSEQEMIEAAQVAQAEEFIETKKHRYESHIAQGGANVSGEMCIRDRPYTGDWSNGMIGVSKTFGGSSILSSPAKNLVKERLFVYLLG